MTKAVASDSFFEVTYSYTIIVSVRFAKCILESARPIRGGNTLLNFSCLRFLSSHGDRRASTLRNENGFRNKETFRRELGSYFDNDADRRSK